MYTNLSQPSGSLDTYDYSLRGMEGSQEIDNGEPTLMSDVMEVIATDQEVGLMEPKQQHPFIRRDISNAYLKIIEQPASKALRFRYECEGRSAGSIPGARSTPENKTYPKVQICGYTGRAVVIVSCVTKDEPFRPHPHNLVGKEGCDKGICAGKVNEDMTVTFANLGIQCVKRKDIEEALTLRESIRVDPFHTGFSHKSQPSSIDLNSVRLCFQPFVEGPEPGKFAIALPPIVSEPIYDKKAMADLVICKMSHCSASVIGGTEMILLCEKVSKEDISVRFFEEKDGQLLWEGFGEFNPTQVHKQVAISLRTPRYKATDVDHPVEVAIQLMRPSDKATSDKLPFKLTPVTGRPPFWSLKRSLGQKTDYKSFSSLLLTKPSKPTLTLDVETPVEDVPKQDANNNQEVVPVSITQEEVIVVDEEPTVVVAEPQAAEPKDQNFDELLQQVKTLEEMYPDNGMSNDFGIYSSFQLALKNPCEMNEFHLDDYETVEPPPRPQAQKPILPPPKAPEPEPEPSLGDDIAPPLPPKRVKKTPQKTLPPVPQKTKMNIFKKLFSSKKKKNQSREGSVVSTVSAKSYPSTIIQDDKDLILTEAEHYALYTDVAPRANVSEFDEMSFYYSPVEGHKTK